MERTYDGPGELEGDVHEEPTGTTDPPRPDTEPRSYLSLWLWAALFLLLVALFFYALSG